MLRKYLKFILAAPVVIMAMTMATLAVPSVASASVSVSDCTGRSYVPEYYVYSQIQAEGDISCGSNHHSLQIEVCTQNASTGAVVSGSCGLFGYAGDNIAAIPDAYDNGTGTDNCGTDYRTLIWVYVDGSQAWYAYPTNFYDCSSGSGTN